MDEGSPEPAGSAGDGRGSGEDGGAVEVRAVDLTKFPLRNFLPKISRWARNQILASKRFSVARSAR
jgi:hypothetical protein